ncbi:MAG: magnesium transporter CorA family protein [Candidatus Methanomethylicaceae archaeon]
MIGMKELRTEEITWINLERPTKEEVMSLANSFPFHVLSLEDTLSKRVLTKVEKYKDYMFTVLRFPTRLCEKGGCTPSQVSFFVGKNFLVTIHDGTVEAINNVFMKCETQYKETGKFALEGVGPLFYKILREIVSSIFPIMENLLERLEDLEDDIFSVRKEVLLEITNLRRTTSDIRRVLSPLRRVVPDLEDGLSDQTGEDLEIYFSDLKDHIEKLWELSDMCRELVEIYKDTDFTLGQQRMNRALVILTVIFTITIPATLVGTFYGMNIPLPGGIETGPWTFLGPYTTFIILLIISFLPAIIMVIYFKKLGWI